MIDRKYGTSKTFLRKIDVLFLTITLETDSIQVIEEQVITKIFKVKVGNQTMTLDDRQASVLYEQLKEKYQAEEELQKEKQSLKINTLVQKASKLGYIQYEDTIIPVGFERIGIKESQSRDGKSVHNYHYFKNKRNEYGYLIKNGDTKPFVRLGKVDDDELPMGKILHISPRDSQFKKSYYVKNKVTVNNQTIKAVVDILTLEGYLKIVGNKTAGILSYCVTKKIEELEFDNNIEPLKVQMTPTHK